MVDWRIDFADVMLDDGFDIVIGNPPYVQLQRNGGELANLYRNVGYKTFARTGDLYQLFYERGCQLLKPGSGLLAYITSNSWLKAEYGKSTRRYIAENHRPTLLLEMGKDVFDEAIVDTSVLILQESTRVATDAPVPAVDIDRLDQDIFPPALKHWGSIRPNGEAPWNIVSVTEQNVMDKMRTKGTPLREWGLNINRGVLTGFNKAFIIDEATRGHLVDQDPNCADIIKPVLRGRDIQRFHSPPSGFYLIDTHNGYSSVPRIDVNDYPAVQAHLHQFYDQLEKRQDKGATPYNLRNCTYHDEFFREKLFWMDLTTRGRFTHVEPGIFSVNTVYMLSNGPTKFLAAILNSSLVTWFMNNSALTSGMGVTRWFSTTVQTIPVPSIPNAQQSEFVRLVDDIIDAKTANPDTDTSAIEVEIDQRVYELYGLSESEMAAIDATTIALSPH